MGAASQPVINMVAYLRETIAEFDQAIADLQAKRAGLAVRLAVIESASDAEVLAAAVDYEARVKAGHPYEGAQDANAFISEAHQRFVP